MDDPTRIVELAALALTMAFACLAGILLAAAVIAWRSDR